MIISSTAEPDSSLVKTEKMLAVFKVYAVIENEPDHTEFPSVTIALYSSEEKANDRCAEEEAERDEEENRHISWYVEEMTVQ